VAGSAGAAGQIGESARPDQRVRKGSVYGHAQRLRRPGKNAGFVIP